MKKNKQIIQILWDCITYVNSAKQYGQKEENLIEQIFELIEQFKTTNNEK